MKLNVIRALIIFFIQAGLFYFVFSQLEMKDGTFTEEKKIRLLIFSVLVGIGTVIISYLTTRKKEMKKLDSDEKIKS